MDSRVAALRAFVYETALAVVLVPGLLFLALEAVPRAPLLVEGVQPVGLLLALAGGVLWLWATVVLVVRGEGTPLPLDPPRRLVVSGPYAALRNPMHLGLVAFFLGEALLFRSSAFVAIVVAGALGLAAYARWREDPVLRERFGAAYDAYAASVPAWAPSPAGAGRALGRLPDAIGRGVEEAVRLVSRGVAAGRRVAARLVGIGRRWVDGAWTRPPR